MILPTNSIVCRTRLIIVQLIQDTTLSSSLPILLFLEVNLTLIMSAFDNDADCPLCMEPLELDDVNFFPCTCGYQICRFCWHRIRTDENGLCPACRKAYPECPADFKPLSEEQLHRIKNEKRQKDIQRKQKITENRKHLASVRVVQKNLVFVVGLSQRLADTEILKKQEYFGKFGKILKVVINQNTSYAGTQSHGPSASAYVTYQRAEDSLRAIQAVNNVHVDGRTLKASLGTTKYCSHFLRNSACPKLDCMYLHELGDENASFTKEDMQMGKHQEYEQKLVHDLLGGGSHSHSPGTTTHTTAPATSATSATINSTSSVTPHVAVTHTGTTGGERTRSQSNTRKKQPSPPTTQPNNRSSPIHTEPWPSLNKANGAEVGGNENKHTEGIRNSPTTQISLPEPTHRTEPTSLIPTTKTSNGQSASRSRDSHLHTNGTAPPIDIPQTRVLPDANHIHMSQDTPPQVQSLPELPPPPVTDTRQPLPRPGVTGPPPNLPPPPRAPFGDIAHLFGGNGFLPPAGLPRHLPGHVPGIHTNNEWNAGGWTAGNDLFPLESNTDWQAAFGFPSETKEKHNEDDLGFDPWKESSQGLADLLEKELQLTPPTRVTQPPPGFSLTQPAMPNTRIIRPETSGSKILPWMHSQPPPTTEVHRNHPGPAPHHTTPNHVPRFPAHHAVPGHSLNSSQPIGQDNIHMKTWQDGLRALLPNINISFGPSQQQQQQQQQSRHAFMNDRLSTVQNTGDSWVGSPTGTSWANQDPAIISIRRNGVGQQSTETNITEGEDKPHWLESLQNLTETDSPPHIAPSQQTNQFFPDSVLSGGVSWGTHLPPPGFQTRPHMQATTEPHKLAEKL